MKQRWGLDNNNALRHLEIPWASTTPLKHWSKRRPPVEPRWAKKQISVQPQPTKYLALCWDYHRVWTPTHRLANKEDSKNVNRDWVNHQACRLSHHIYIIAYAFVSHVNFLKLIRYDFYANHPLTFCKARQIILSMLICFPLQIFLKLDRQHFIIQIADRKEMFVRVCVCVCVWERERDREEAWNRKWRTFNDSLKFVF